MLTRESIVELREQFHQTRPHGDEFFKENFLPLLEHAEEVVNMQKRVAEHVGTLEELCKQRTKQLHDTVHTLHKHLDEMHEATGIATTPAMDQLFREFKGEPPA